MEIWLFEARYVMWVWSCEGWGWSREMWSCEGWSSHVRDVGT